MQDSLYFTDSKIPHPLLSFAAVPEKYLQAQESYTRDASWIQPSPSCGFLLKSFSLGGPLKKSLKSICHRAVSFRLSEGCVAWCSVPKSNSESGSLEAKFISRKSRPFSAIIPFLQRASPLSPFPSYRWNLSCTAAYNHSTNFHCLGLHLLSQNWKVGSSSQESVGVGRVPMCGWSGQ